MARLINIVMIIGMVLVSVFAAEELYSDKYDDIDVMGILTNDRLRDQYYSCFMSTGPCTTADMKFYKEIIGEGLITKCKKCTEKQKENLNTLTDWYTKNKIDDWNAFVKKMMEEFKQKNGGQ